ncbi:4Fe-4S ferredoxin [Methylobacterium sp. Leaf113]|uniref:lactate utilization protein B n=1 Tax=Methylobacterium sp. Leaf113 TaxID=1736259 RepID=UPI0006F3A42D|nr:lactate utilization protein B [Methylobacterium sp. Leaf113]KQP91042.1 4Fe-4S ferredoxin [Methylobacterium sp. Leaf113]
MSASDELRPRDDARRDGVIHPEVLAGSDESERGQDGQRLQHAEGASRPISAKAISPKAPREPQPRGAKIRGDRPIDQAEAAERFLAAPLHQKAHDARLWDLRTKRDTAAFGIPEWEELRELASQIKTHTLANLDRYLEQFEAQAKANGVHVHWAADGAEHNRIVHGILKDHGAKSLIKSKSMLTEECGFRHYMAGTGIEVIETDLGERIQQLDNEEPSHVVVPAVHKTRFDVAEVFSRTMGTDPENDDAHYLAESQRMHTRPLILEADAGLTGCNFAIAETGTVVTCTNEGNADLSGNVPKLQIHSIGIEKLIPRIEHLGVFLRLLSRSALGSPITQYTSHFRAPRKGTEMHMVLVDNGRSERLGMEEFWTSLKCIRCGACMNTCPVYRRSGGLSYGATYSGPIGLIIDPTFNKRKYSTLPFSSTMNGSCTNVCPVKINIHEQIFAWRKVLAEEHQIPLLKQGMMKAAGQVLSRPATYRAAIGAADSALKVLPRFAVYNPLNTWGKGREMPEAPRQTFHAWYKQNRMGKADPKSVGSKSSGSKISDGVK